MTSLESARNALLELAELTAADVSDEELLEGSLFRLSETIASDVAHHTTGGNRSKRCVMHSHQARSLATLLV